jgi:hypothetical protein
MNRASLATSLLLHLLFVSPSVASNSVSYPASEVAFPTREAQSPGSDFLSLDFAFKTDGTFTEEQLAWCENVVARTFAALPEDQVAEVQNLTLSFNSDIRRGQAGGHTMILRCVNVDEAELTAVIVHEMGHIVDTSYLESSTSDIETSFDDRGQPVYDGDPSVQLYSVSWEDNRSFTSSSSGFISGYAMSNPYEDFAETYAAYVLHGPLFRLYSSYNKDLKEKYDFMKDVVFEGREFDFADEDLPVLSVVDQRVYDITRVDFDLESFWALTGLH